MAKSLTKFAKYKAFIPTVILFILSIAGVFTTYFFQYTEDELNNEILVVEHQNLLLNVAISFDIGIGKWDVYN